MFLETEENQAHNEKKVMSILETFHMLGLYSGPGSFNLLIHPMMMCMVEGTIKKVMVGELAGEQELKKKAITTEPLRVNSFYEKKKSGTLSKTQQ